jgi:hypothetical protein
MCTRCFQAYDLIHDRLYPTSTDATGEELLQRSAESVRDSLACTCARTCTRSCRFGSTPFVLNSSARIARQPTKTDHHVLQQRKKIHVHQATCSIHIYLSILSHICTTHCLPTNIKPSYPTQLIKQPHKRHILARTP